MQVSDLYRRGIVLPLDAKAEASLRCNDIKGDTPVKYLQIAGQPFFDRLWEIGLFQAINIRSGSLIDDYEQEFVELNAIENIRTAIDEVRAKGYVDSEISSFLDDLDQLSLEARKSGRAVLFVL